MTKQAQWKIVDQNGDLVMSADDVATQARFLDTTPKRCNTDFLGRQDLTIHELHCDRVAIEETLNRHHQRMALQTISDGRYYSSGRRAQDLKIVADLQVAIEDLQDKENAERKAKAARNFVDSH